MNKIGIWLYIIVYAAVATILKWPFWICVPVGIIGAFINSIK